jgi:hypothetical protein
VTHLILAFTAVVDSLIGAPSSRGDLPGIERQRVTNAGPSPVVTEREENDR